MADASQTIEIRAEEVAKAFGEHIALTNVSVEIARAQIAAIVGMSGSGKTVLLDILTGLLKPDSGRILVRDHSKPELPLLDLQALDGDQLDEVRLHWAVVFQQNALFSGSVRENVALWLREHTDMDETAIEERIRESLKAVALDPDDVINKTREELSGGMAKRVAIARAIAVDPAVIFYDEPTTGLDPLISSQIHELIFNVHQRPRADGSARTSVFVTHDKDLLRRVQPRVIMLQDHGVAFDGTYEDFGLSEAAHAYFESMPVLHARPIPDR